MNDNSGRPQGRRNCRDNTLCESVKLCSGEVMLLVIRSTLIIGRWYQVLFTTEQSQSVTVLLFTQTGQYSIGLQLIGRN